MSAVNPTGGASAPKQGTQAPVLQLGNSGEWVRTLQEMLGFTGSEVDGIFGPQTEAKLVEYQKAHGIDPSGKVDAGTWKVLGTNGPLNGQTIDNTGSDGGLQGAPAQAGNSQGGGLTAQQWATELLKRLGAPTSSTNVQAIMAWERAEGGHWENNASYNPLNTTQDATGAGNINSAGVKAYSSWQQGLDATVQTLENGRYRPILAALKQGNNSGTVLNAVVASPWSSYPHGISINGAETYGTGEGKTAGPGSGGASGAYSGAGAGNGQLTQQDLSTSLDSFGFPKALVDSDPSLQKAFNKILTQQLDITTSTGQARAEQILHGTQWWKSRTDAQRSFDAKMKDPATRQEALREIDQQKNDLRSLALNLGYPINGPVLDQLARMSVRNKLDTNEINNALAGHFQYHPNQDQYTGVAGSDISGLNKLAGDYYVNLGRGQIQDMVQRMIKGQLSPDAMTQYFQQQAEGAFPQLKQQIKSGYTVKDVLAPYLQDYANILELDPSAIKPEDPSLMKALQQPDGQGGFQLMPRWQFQQMLRNDPRWLNTQNAKATYLSTGIQVLKDWGLAS